MLSWAAEGGGPNDLYGGPPRAAAPTVCVGAGPWPARRYHVWKGAIVMAKEYKLSPQRLKELQDEMTYLKTVREKEVADLIKEARSFGDLSENSEYDEAKNEQAIVEARILTLEEQLKVVRVVDRTALDKDVVNIGSVVKLLDCRFNEELEYRIVSSVEGGSASNTLTDKSPVGEAVMGHKAGETVEVHAPKGVFSLKILEIHN